MQLESMTTYFVNQTDLESFLNEKYRMEFDFIRATGRAYPDCVEYIVNGKLSDTECVRKRIARARKGQWSQDVSFLLNLLCSDGHIPVGKYVVRVEKVKEYKDWYMKLIEKYGLDFEELSQFR